MRFVVDEVAVHEGFLLAHPCSTNGSYLYVVRGDGQLPVMDRSSAEPVPSHHDKLKVTHHS